MSSGTSSISFATDCWIGGRGGRIWTSWFHDRSPVVFRSFASNEQQQRLAAPDPRDDKRLT